MIRSTNASECWASVEAGAPAVNHDWLNVCWINRFSAETFDDMADPDCRLVPVVAGNSEVLRSNSNQVGCLSSRLCI